ncbi:unnamed protein product [Dibothriocephalus latus]|uniref:FH2 domain-containing protein n=1 Tax=Dibothriocephalus latus TaxID=60516 RepID=A0A3P6R4L4_DIBLA|nr:unnamed protein product [Dibothriocephalus latus]
MESEKFTLDKLWQGITNLDVSLDVADRILHQLPTPEEAKMYLNYEFTDSQSLEELTDEDRLLLHLCKVQRLSAKLEIIIFMNTFETSLATLNSVGPPVCCYCFLYFPGRSGSFGWLMILAKLETVARSLSSILCSLR